MPPGSSVGLEHDDLAPRPRAVAAATSPAKPPPTTTTSVSLSHEAGGRSFAVDVHVPFGLDSASVVEAESAGEFSVRLRKNSRGARSRALAHATRARR